MEYDFISIGDIVVDAFIRITDADEHVDVKTHLNELCFRFGDKVPYESVTVLNAVGNAPNGATAAARLGLTTALVTNLGDDQQGKDCLAQLASEGIGHDFVRVNAGAKTNYHYVLWHEVDRTILIKHEVYPVSMPEIGSPKWIYFSSVGAYADKLHDLFADYAEAHPEVKYTFQPGVFEIKLGTKRLARMYARAELVVCNVEEAWRILETEEQDIKKLLAGMHALGPKIVLITDGPKGAYASDGTNAWFMPIYPDPKPPFERTGAGDAFASTFSAALANGEAIETALLWAPINSMSVVQEVGAQAGLLMQTQIQEWLQKAPSDYKPTLL